MFDDIFAQHGHDILGRVSEVMLVTGDLNDEAAMLDLIRTIYFGYLLPNGFRGCFLPSLR